MQIMKENKVKENRGKKIQSSQRKIFAIGLLLTILIFLLAGCSGKQKEAIEGERVFTDFFGQQVEIKEAPQRILSLSPAATEILFALGLDEEIVGTTDYCNYPEAALSKPKVGGFTNPNMEIIVQAEPDLILLASGVQTEYIEAFKKYGLTTFVLDAQTIDQVIENILLVGDITLKQDEAKIITDDMLSRINFVKEKTQGLEKPLVFFEVWDDPLLSAGPETFIADILEISSAENFAADAKSDYPQISLELLLERDPDIYMAIDHKNNLPAGERPGFQNLQAVKNGKYFRIEDDLVTKPGPRVILGLEEIASNIHPDIFN